MDKPKDRCRLCGRPLLMLQSFKGHLIPCDPEPVYFAPQIWSTTRFVMPDASTFNGVIVSKDDPDAHKGYISHKATCPAAKRFRRRK
jgi:hypothetical protein